ncbi:MAG: ABC transporter substrate-binding protein, partial [Candidatus Omnitrophica bacterium]|nr:ABC transporter substrate-binding protein [Candidatus Omnitrophota bacterium]
MTAKKCFSLIFLSLFFVTFSSLHAAGDKKIKIGFAAPLTGDQAQIGIETLNGVKLAVEQANEKGEILPGFRLEVYALDDQHNPSQAVIVARKFISDPDVAAVVG